MKENEGLAIRTLVVEDEEKIAQNICGKIRKNDPDFKIVGTAANGKEALALIEECRPQVVFTDIAMPVMDGMELSRRIRSSNPNTVIVLLSGYSDFSYARQAIRYGVSNYLLKPLEDEVLLETLYDIKISLSYTAVRTTRHMVYSENYQILPEEGERFLLAQVCMGNVIYNVQDEEVLQFYLEQTAGIPWSKIMERLWGEKAEWYVADEHTPNQKIVCCKAGIPEEEAVEERMGQLQSLMKEYTDLPVSICCGRGTVPQEEIWNRTKRLRHVMKQRLVIGTDGIFFTEEQGGSPNDVLEIVKMKLGIYIRNYFISKDLDNFMLEIQNIFKYLRNNHATQEIVEKICFYVLKLLEFSDQDYDPQFLEGRMDQMVRSISISISEEELFANLMKEFGLLSRYMEISDEDNVEKLLFNYVEEHYLTIESVEQVAEEFGYNYTYLSRLFKKKAGVPMNRYITGKKMTLARELLGTRPDMKLTEISDICGYNDSKYFFRVFKTEVGMTPGEYREKYRTYV